MRRPTLATCSWGQHGWFKVKRGENHMMIESDCAWAVPTSDNLQDVLSGKVAGDYLQGLSEPSAVMSVSTVNAVFSHQVTGVFAALEPKSSSSRESLAPSWAGLTILARAEGRTRGSEGVLSYKDGDEPIRSTHTLAAVVLGVLAAVGLVGLGAALASSKLRAAFQGGYSSAPAARPAAELQQGEQPYLAY